MIKKGNLYIITCASSVEIIYSGLERDDEGPYRKNRWNLKKKNVKNPILGNRIESEKEVCLGPKTAVLMLGM